MDPGECQTTSGVAKKTCATQPMEKCMTAIWSRNEERKTEGQEQSHEVLAILYPKGFMSGSGKFFTLITMQTCTKSPTSLKLTSCVQLSVCFNEELIWI